MTITYTWQILSLKVSDELPDFPKAVVQVKWRKTGVDEDGTEAHFDGSSKISTKSISPETYITFDNLTEDDIISWVRGIDDRGNGAVDKMIQAAIIEKKNAVESTIELPWKKTEN